jgi:hypothetical protein
MTPTQGRFGNNSQVAEMTSRSLTRLSCFALALTGLRPAGVARVSGTSAAHYAQRPAVPPPIRHPAPAGRCGDSWTSLREIPWASGALHGTSIASSNFVSVAVGAYMSPTGMEADDSIIGWQLQHDAALPIPRLGGHFLRPKAAVAGNAIRIVWGESEHPIDAGRRGPPTINELWSARLDEKNQWTDVSRVFVADRIFWSEWASDRASGSGSAPAYFVAPVIDRGIVLISARQNGTDVALLQQAKGAAYATVAADPIGSVHIAFLRGDTTGPFERRQGYVVRHDQNSVFIMGSSDSGKSWTTPLLVSRSGEFPAFQLRAAQLDSTNIHLVWLQTVPSNAPAVIRHVATHDAGRTWSTPEDLALPSGTATILRMVVDACETMHVIVEYRPDEGLDRHTRLLYASHPRESGWTALVDPFPNSSLSDADLAVTSMGNVVLTATGQLRRAPDSPRRLIVAELHSP